MARPSVKTVEELLTFLQARGPLAAAEVIAGLDVSQSTFSRLARAAGPKLLAIGRGRAAMYGARRTVRTIGDTIPLFRVSPDGKCEPLGLLTALHPGGFAFHPKKTSAKPQLFPGIPFFLTDHRPQGFMGRTFAERNPELRLPARIVDWSEDDFLEAICRRGEDAPGNLIAGRESFERYQTAFLAGKKPLAEKGLKAHYKMAATAALEAEMPGSSAGGEQPKFTVSFSAGKKVSHAIVKFSPRTSGFAGKRWRDLLVAESIALDLLTGAGWEASSARVCENVDRAFLEVQRFDRSGTFGRIGTLSLGPIEDEWFGRRDNWVAAAVRLEAKGTISAQDARVIRFLYSFGGLIANSDRHFGNLSFFFELGFPRLRLTPAYDMLPMLYAPSQIDAIERERLFVVEPPMAEAVDEWNEALPLAVNFWERVAKDKRVSPNFRGIAKKNAGLLKRAGS